MRQMKESGNKSIGSIPVSWNVIPLKYLYDNSNGSAVRVGPFGSALTSSDIVDSGIWIYNQKTIMNNDFSCNDTYVSKEKAQELSAFSVNPGDILVTTRGTVGRIAVVPEAAPQGVLHPCVIRFRIDEKKFNKDLLTLIFNDTDLVNKQIMDMSNSTTIEVLYSYSLKEIRVPVPTINEQNRIVDYLQTNCFIIDSIIEKQEAIIEKLKEYKLSVITEAVTKGLDPNVEMKDSGIEWIGKCPASWSRAKLNNLCSFHNGDRSSNYPSPDDFVDDGIPFIGADSLNGFYVDCSVSKHITTEKYSSMGGIKIKEGDILYTLRGSTIGKNSIAGFNDGTVASSLMGIRIDDRDKLDSKFLLYYLNSEMEYIQRDVCINGSTAPNLSADDVKNFVIFIPAIDEQVVIANALNDECSRIDNQIECYERIIEKLQQYKKSLIYEVVTGKREV